MSELKTDKLSKFRPSTQNANRHNARGLKLLSEAMGQVGYVAPITVAADGETLDGSARLETAFDQFGDEAIILHHDGKKPIVMVRDDIPNAHTPEAKRIAVEANRIGQIDLSWDVEVLDQIRTEVDISQLWNEAEWSELLESFGSELLGGNGQGSEPPEVTETEAEKLQQKWQTSPGDVWQLGRHKIACLDSTDEETVKRLLDGLTVGMVWADPPYGMELDADFSVMRSRDDFASQKQAFGGKKYPDVIGDDKPFDPTFLMSFFKNVPEQIWWGADYYADKIPGRNNGSWIVWDKRVDEAMDSVFGSSFELAWSKGKHKRDIFRIRWAGIFGIEQEQIKRRLHPTQKPTSLAFQCFQKYGKPDDLIFDPFLGSGISTLAAEQLNDGRSVIGCELSPDYIAVCLERWTQLTKQQPQRVSG